MRILVLSCIHNQIDKLSKILDKVSAKDVDLIICAGDFTDMFYNPSDFDQVDMCELIIEKLLALKKPLLAVPGNHDPYEVLDVFDDYNINLHEKIKTLEKLKFVGYGGAQTPFNTIFEPTEDEIKRGLGKLANKLSGDFVFVAHNPPKNTKCDKIAAGEHVGSANIREFIEKMKPVFVVCGHIHESHSLDKIGGSIVLNCGAVCENKYAIAEIKDGQVKCELKSV